MSKSRWIAVLAALVAVLAIEVWALNQQINRIYRAVGDEFDKLTTD